MFRRLEYIAWALFATFTLGVMGFAYWHTYVMTITLHMHTYGH